MLAKSLSFQTIVFWGSPVGNSRLQVNVKFETFLLSRQDQAIRVGVIMNMSLPFFIRKVLIDSATYWTTLSNLNNTNAP